MRSSVVKISGIDKLSWNHYLRRRRAEEPKLAAYTQFKLEATKLEQTQAIQKSADSFVLAVQHQQDSWPATNSLIISIAEADL